MLVSALLQSPEILQILTLTSKTLAFNAIRDVRLDLLYVFGENVPDVNIDIAAVAGPPMSDDVEWVKKCLMMQMSPSSVTVESRRSKTQGVQSKIFNQALVDPFLEMEDPTAAADVKKVFTPLGAKATQFSEPNAGPFGYWPNLRKISD